MSTQKNASIGQKKSNDFNDELLLYTRIAMVPKVPLRGSFAVHERSDHPCQDEVRATRRDYYKISFFTKGTGIFTMGDDQYEINGPTLMFINPFELKTWRATSKEQEGYYCLFTDLLFDTMPDHQENLLQHPLWQLGSKAVFTLTNEQCNYLQSIFRQLMREYHDDAAFKQEALLIYLKLIMLEGKRLSAPTQAPRALNAAQMLANRFIDKLEKQFPIEQPHHQMKLKTAKEFAQVLNTHPNHLNACIKQSTGRTVSEHIRQRMLLEARLLLIHTDWQIAEIAWCLGFEDPGNFTHFFKNHSGIAPHMYRVQ
ncbi:AraC family transcriptional regulator [Chitinophaga sp. 30R24]|uniref:AraC family transcriptional regulator n=1 Tax=Chitinophaga sp. 30R24 TaxID=3248838 RepID=UPI003B8F6D6E